MTWEEYNQLFHRAHVNEVAFKRVIDCDEELRKMVEMAVEAERKKRQWVGLTDEDVAKLAATHLFQNVWPHSTFAAICAIEAKLKEKNT